MGPSQEIFLNNFELDTVQSDVLLEQKYLISYDQTSILLRQELVTLFWGPNQQTESKAPSSRDSREKSSPRAEPEIKERSGEEAPRVLPQRCFENSNLQLLLVAHIKFSDFATVPTYSE